MLSLEQLCLKRLETQLLVCQLCLSRKCLMFLWEMALRGSGVLTSRLPLILLPSRCVLRILKLRLPKPYTRALLTNGLQVSVGTIHRGSRLVAFANIVNFLGRPADQGCCSSFSKMGTHSGTTAIAAITESCSVLTFTSCKVKPNAPPEFSRYGSIGEWQNS